MRGKVAGGLLVVLSTLFFISSSVMAGKEMLLCISNKSLKGEETVNTCIAKGETFAVVDEFGFVRILKPEEVEMTRAFNPKAFETRAYGLQNSMDMSKYKLPMVKGSEND
jgi:hypothetical protein